MASLFSVFVLSCNSVQACALRSQRFALSLSSLGLLTKLSSRELLHRHRSFLASLSVITPWFVEMIAVPSPPSTFGRFSLASVYTKTWFRNSLEACDNFFVLISTVFQCDVNCFEYSVFNNVVFFDISFI